MRLFNILLLVLIGVLFPVLAEAQAVSQTISPIIFSPTTLVVGQTDATSATATSGLPLTYGTTTPSICSVNSNTGAVTALMVGTCIVTANQPGNLPILSITPTSPAIAPGATIQLTPTATDQQGNTITVPANLTWASGNAGVTVDSTGLVTASSTATGTALITVTDPASQATANNTVVVCTSPQVLQNGVCVTPSQQVLISGSILPAGPYYSGQSVSMSATVTAVGTSLVPTGSVSFPNPAGNTICTAALDSQGLAQCNGIITFGIGTPLGSSQNIYAKYSGDQNFVAGGHWAPWGIVIPNAGAPISVSARYCAVWFPSFNLTTSSGPYAPITEGAWSQSFLALSPTDFISWGMFGGTPSSPVQFTWPISFSSPTTTFLFTQADVTITETLTPFGTALTLIYSGTEPYNMSCN